VIPAGSGCDARKSPPRSGSIAGAISSSAVPGEPCHAHGGSAGLSVQPGGIRNEAPRPPTDRPSHQVVTIGVEAALGDGFGTVDGPATFGGVDRGRTRRAATTMATTPPMAA